MSDFIKVTVLSEIPKGEGKLVEVDGREIALYQHEGKVYAIDNICPHAGGPMAEGACNGELAMCPWHGWEFNIKTGICDFNDQIRLECFEVKIEGEDVYVKA